MNPPGRDELMQMVAGGRSVREMSFQNVLKKILQPAGVKVGGFPEDMFLDLTPEEQEKWVCGICFLILKDARECDNKHVFCHTCIFAWTLTYGENSQTCPVCRSEQGTRYNPNREIDTTLGDKRVQCPEKGCGFRSPLRAFLLHSHGKLLFSNAGVDLEALRPPRPAGARLLVLHPGIPDLPPLQRVQGLRDQLQQGRAMIHQMMVLLHLEMALRQRAMASYAQARSADQRQARLDEVLALNEQLSEVGGILSGLLGEPLVSIRGAGGGATSRRRRSPQEGVSGVGGRRAENVHVFQPGTIPRPRNSGNGEQNRDANERQSRSARRSDSDQDAPVSRARSLGPRNHREIGDVAEPTTARDVNRETGEQANSIGRTSVQRRSLSTPRSQPAPTAQQFRDNAGDVPGPSGQHSVTGSTERQDVGRNQSSIPNESVLIGRREQQPPSVTNQSTTSLLNRRASRVRPAASGSLPGDDPTVSVEQVTSIGGVSPRPGTAGRNTPILPPIATAAGRVTTPRGTTPLQPISPANNITSPRPVSSGARPGLPAGSNAHQNVMQAMASSSVPNGSSSRVSNEQSARTIVIDRTNEESAPGPSGGQSQPVDQDPSIGARARDQGPLQNQSEPGRDEVNQTPRMSYAPQRRFSRQHVESQSLRDGLDADSTESGQRPNSRAVGSTERTARAGRTVQNQGPQGTSRRSDNGAREDQRASSLANRNDSITNQNTRTGINSSSRIRRRNRSMNTTNRTDPLQNPGGTGQEMNRPGRLDRPRRRSEIVRDLMKN